jgi:hypothetical protein
MSTVIEKQVRLDGDRARRLEALAVKVGVSEDALIEAGLDLLFQMSALDEATREDMELFLQLQSECGSLPPYRKGEPIDPATIVQFAGTPIRPESIRRRGE